MLNFDYFPFMQDFIRKLLISNLLESSRIGGGASNSMARLTQIKIQIVREGQDAVSCPPGCDAKILWNWRGGIDRIFFG